MALPELAASSPLAASRELNAHLQAPAMVGINHRGELGGFAFAASLFQTWCFFAQRLDCQLFPRVIHSALGSQSETSPKHHTCTAGLQGKCSAIGGNEWREGKPPELVAQMPQVHIPSMPQGNTGPTSSARSQDVPGIGDGGTRFRNPHDLKGFSVSP